ncbi:MAG: HlyD family efflux transporter periplasmic adaptor subunit, partial [Chloroflexi bacterium]|nr:HlyD family efflux transporter periplasmic adaptor subunit [Chloroflexota bacterium]
MTRAGEARQIVRGARRRILRLAIPGVMTVAVASSAGWYFLVRDTTEAPPPIETAQATRGTLATTVTLPGTASSTASVSLTFPVAGKVAEVNVVIGQAVKAGDQLAKVDDTDLRQTLQTAQNNLDLARLKLAQLQAPAKPEDAQAARQAVVAADISVQNAQVALERLKRPPTAVDFSTADVAILQAQASLDSAQRSVDATFASLKSVLDTYCDLTGLLPFEPCFTDLRGIPLTADVIVRIQQVMGPPNNLPAAYLNAATNLVNANNSYVNAAGSVTPAKASLEQAKRKRAQLDEAPDNLDLYAAGLALSNARESYKSAVAREAALQRGPDPLDVQAQQLSVRTQEIAVATAQQKVTDTVLRAPFAGTVGAAPLIVGQQVGTATAAVTLTDTGTIQVKMTLSESDLPQVRAGQLGVATFDALAGQTFIVRVFGVSPIPTVTQGVVTYAAQASILRGPELVEIQADLQKLAAALSSGSARTAAIQLPGVLGAGAAATGTPGAEPPATTTASATAASTAAAKGTGLPGGGQRPQGAGPGGAGGAGA